MSRRSADAAWRGIKASSRSEKWTDQFAATAVAVAFLEKSLDAILPGRQRGDRLPIPVRLKRVAEFGIDVSGILDITNLRNDWVHEVKPPRRGFDIPKAIDRLHRAWEEIGRCVITRENAGVVCQRWRQRRGILQAHLFGSLARRSATPGDIDILLLDDGTHSSRLAGDIERHRAAARGNDFARLSELDRWEKRFDHMGYSVAVEVLLEGLDDADLERGESLAAAEGLGADTQLQALSHVGWLDVVVLPHPEAVGGKRDSLIRFQERQRDPRFLWKIAQDVCEWNGSEFIVADHRLRRYLGGSSQPTKEDGSRKEARVFHLAREWNVSDREALTRIQSSGVVVAGATSFLSESDLARLREVAPPTAEAKRSRPLPPLAPGSFRLNLGETWKKR